MRYRKGSIVISEAFDIPLLLLIRNSGYITHEQLIALSGYDKSQSAVCNFLWRIRRLLAGGFVGLFDRRIEGRKVYSITHTGLLELEFFGHSLSSLNAQTQVICHPSKMMHCLELNAVRLSMVRHGIAELWLNRSLVNCRKRQNRAYVMRTGLNSVVNLPENTDLPRY